MVFWLIALDVPYAKCILNLFNIAKKSEKNPVCISKHCLFTYKVQREKDILCDAFKRKTGNDIWIFFWSTENWFFSHMP
jgi:hypothetical protein